MNSRHSLLPIAVALAACLWTPDAMAQPVTIPVTPGQENRSAAHAGIATHDTGDRLGTGDRPGPTKSGSGPTLDSAAALRRQALAAMEMLREEIATLTALKHAQAALLAWNRGRTEADEGPATLDAALCNDPALAPWCRVLPATFGTGELSATGERPETRSPTAEESRDRD